MHIPNNPSQSLPNAVHQGGIIWVPVPVVVGTLPEDRPHSQPKMPVAIEVVKALKEDAHKNQKPLPLGWGRRGAHKRLHCMRDDIVCKAPLSWRWEGRGQVHLADDTEAGVLLLNDKGENLRSLAQLRVEDGTTKCFAFVPRSTHRCVGGWCRYCSWHSAVYFLVLGFGLSTQSTSIKLSWAAGSRVEPQKRYSLFRRSKSISMINRFILILSCWSRCLTFSKYTTPPPIKERFCSYFRFVQFCH